MKIKKVWADMIMAEIKNPKTYQLDLSREIAFEHGLPIMNLNIKLKQKADVEEYGTEEIHRLAGTIAPLQKVEYENSSDE